MKEVESLRKSLHAPGITQAIQESITESSQCRESMDGKYCQNNFYTLKARPDKMRIEDLPKDTSITVLKPQSTNDNQSLKLTLNIMKKKLDKAKYQTEKFEDERLRIQVSCKYEINNMYKEINSLNYQIDCCKQSTANRDKLSKLLEEHK